MVKGESRRTRTEIIGTAVKVIVVLTIVVGIILGLEFLGWDQPIKIWLGVESEPLPWSVLGGAAEVTECHEIDGHSIYVVSVLSSDADTSYAGWWMLYAKLIKASKLKPDHAVYVHFVEDINGQRIVTLSISLGYDLVDVLDNQPETEQEMFDALTGKFGFVPWYMWLVNGDMSQETVAWDCEPDNSDCAMKFSYVAAGMLDHAWKDVFRIERNDDSN